MSVVKQAGKLVALLVLAYAFFIAYTYSLPFVQAVGLQGGGLALVWVVVVAAAQSMVLACAWGVVFAFPFALLWGRFAYLAALAGVAPLIVTMFVLSFHHEGKLILLSLILFSIACLLAIVPISAQVAHRWLERRSRAPRRSVELGA